MTKITVNRSINIEDWTLDRVLLQLKELIQRINKYHNSKVNYIVNT